MGNFRMNGDKNMPNTNERKHKHLTPGDRQEIMECLDKGMTFKAIGKRVGKDQTTISKEVKKHIEVREPEVKATRPDGTAIKGRLCAMLLKAPFVCNPCKKRRVSCGYQKQLYVAPKAQLEYRTLLVEAREGIPFTKEEFWASDRIIADKMKGGQRLYHIMVSNDIGFSKSSAYRHFAKGRLSVSKIKLPRAVKFKLRRTARPDTVPKALKAGRTYSDFRRFVEEKRIDRWVEMDTVIGSVGGKVILTLCFTFCNFMAGLLLDNKTALEASSKIRGLKERFAAAGKRFGDVLPVILTDNGGEFSNVAAFTAGVDGAPETALYFCDPHQSSQKPKVEKNHSVFRDIVPKGESFDGFTQDTVDLVFSHVNGIKRKVLHGKSPYDVFAFMLGPDTARLPGVSEVPPGQVVQSPLLLGARVPPTIGEMAGFADSPGEGGALL